MQVKLNQRESQEANIGIRTGRDHDKDIGDFLRTITKSDEINKNKIDHYKYNYNQAEAEAKEQKKILDKKRKIMWKVLKMQNWILIRWNFYFQIQ